MNAYFRTLIPSVIEAGFAAGAAFFATYSQSDGKTAALAAGATGLKSPEKVFWGGYSGYWADLDGHVWEVAMNPFWPLNEDGSLTLPKGDA